MSSVIRKIAEYLLKYWPKMSNWLKQAIITLAGSAIVDAIARGLNALINYLSTLSSAVIEAIAKLLGL
ncbi:MULTISPECIES: hypothetical protein [Bacillaceae]|jgi:hypothetical protein|uniref:Uncharacterized protein n=1 Tax=Geobacillus stearothermophilus TaxID=1422 RepID=A0A3L7D9P2_GEOSE|nr:MULTISPECIES: hypothetical protein [Bacillaceae]KMY58740.1 hypothetical protein AA905_12875 [Geobacillus stearothermophilus]KMY62297.1 hypothetical protein AA906_02515 [Geobacillus stearothermophilus]KMY63276.1 hypothetical protein AA904_03890 [Geobacillus stearothermophilus]MED3778605.1 hypothetical protein [Geobacillus stearothermophilus]MED4960724.1 hypothetical protein [Geobacillus stearothermophilus]